MADSYSIFNFNKILHRSPVFSSCHLRNNQSDLSTQWPVDARHQIQITHAHGKKKPHCPLSGLIHLVLLHTAYNLKICSSLYALAPGVVPLLI